MCINSRQARNDDDSFQFQAITAKYHFRSQERGEENGGRQGQ